MLFIISAARMTLKEGFYKVELINTVWEVPERYQNLLPVGSGAFGQVSIITKMISGLELYFPRVQGQDHLIVH